MAYCNNIDQSGIITENSNKEQRQRTYAEILSPSDGFVSANFSSCNCRKRRFATTFVRATLGKYFEALVLTDSGSCNSLINIKTWKKIVNHDEISKSLSESCLRFKSSNGNTLSCIGRANIRFRIGESEIIHPSYVIDGECHSFIMGCDLISRLKATVNFANEEMIINDKKYPLLSVITHQEPHKCTETNVEYFI